MSYWYLQRRDRRGRTSELLLDLDVAARLTKTGEPWIEGFFRKRLRAAIEAGKLDVQAVYIDRSETTHRFHAVVKLGKPVPVIEALVWQLHLGSDLYRGRADLMRAARGIAAPSLLIRSRKFLEFYREPDRECACKVKHDTDTQARLGTLACQVWRELRGHSPWELFGPSSKGPEPGVALPLGKVPLSLILRRG